MSHLLRSPLRLFFPLLVVAACASRDEVPNESAPPLGPSDCKTTCAPDNRTVLDCHGEVTSTCSAAAACFNGECMQGCEQAAKSESTVGCEYYAAKPNANARIPAGADASCYAVLIANTWDTPVELQVDYQGTPISSTYFRIPRGHGNDIRYELLPEGKLPRDELAVLFLAMETEPNGFGTEWVPCHPDVGAAIVGKTNVPATGYGQMFHIRSSAPVVAYDIYPYGGAETYMTSSTLLYPTSAWGTENLVMGSYPPTAQDYTQGIYPYFQILAREDETHVKLRPTTTLSSVDSKPQLEPGQVGEYLLQRGQFLQFTQALEAVGTAVESDKPVAIVGGSPAVLIPEGKAALDTIHQQVPPIKLLGDMYVATRYRDREGPAEPETTPWRIVAVVDGTELTYDPPIPDAPAKLDARQSKDFWAPGPFVVRSQDKNHPIYVALYMTAGFLVSSQEGDPEMVSVVPVGQYLPSYVFLTDPTYGNTNLVFVRAAVDGKYEDVTLDCVGNVSDWKKVGNSGYEIAYVDLIRKEVPQGACDNGIHKASSKNPFALTVWGWDRTASYGFPAGMGTKPLNDVPAIR